MAIKQFASQTQPSVELRMCMWIQVTCTNFFWFPLSHKKYTSMKNTSNIVLL